LILNNRALLYRVIVEQCLGHKDKTKFRWYGPVLTTKDKSSTANTCIIETYSVYTIFEGAEVPHYDLLELKVTL
jgi:hypothetical protein